jgi:hypothetical protein
MTWHRKDRVARGEPDADDVWGSHLGLLAVVFDLAAHDHRPMGDASTHAAARAEDDHRQPRRTRGGEGEWQIIFVSTVIAMIPMVLLFAFF